MVFKSVAPLIIILFLVSTSHTLFAQDFPTPTPNRNPYGDFNLIYFGLPYETLQEWAFCADSKASGSDRRKTKNLIAVQVKKKKDFLNNLFSLASNPSGRTDTKGSERFLRNEAHMYLGNMIKNHDLADGALFNAEATIKYFLYMDKTVKNPDLPRLKMDYQGKALQLINDAESAHKKGDYVMMQNKLYQALLTVYPVTSMSLL